MGVKSLFLTNDFLNLCYFLAQRLILLGLLFYLSPIVKIKDLTPKPHISSMELTMDALHERPLLWSDPDGITRCFGTNVPFNTKLNSSIVPKNTQNKRLFIFSSTTESQKPNHHSLYYQISTLQLPWHPAWPVEDPPSCTMPVLCRNMH